MSGRRPMTWIEIDAYVRLTEALSEPWEARWMHGASAAYCDELERGKSPLCIAPVERG